MLLFIGSVALNQFLDQPREPKDVDAIADYEAAAHYLSRLCSQIYPINGGKTLFGRADDGTIYEIEIAWPDTSAAKLLELIKVDVNLANCLDPAQDYWSASLNLLYTLKMSHRYLRNSPFFLKTRNDIMFMRTLGARIPNEWSDWYKTREKETYWYKLPNLDQSKEQFFNDLYQYDHDSLHEAVAINSNGKPAYTYYQSNTARGVQCSKQAFYDTTEAIRLCGVVEEAMVLSLERSLIPHPGVKTEREAFIFALQKVCTSITSGWFREYAYENYDRAVAMYDNLLHKQLWRLEAGLEFGIVKENPEWSPKSIEN